MNNLPLRILAHAVIAAILFYAFQRYALGATPETGALWAIVGAVGAGILAWSQHKRGA